ncbi:hypothetical protein H0H81_006264 [Sphagnurus paluster]|uniref:XRRM domain-containing protein n=1 Tax=Sphagnurus paluster TaxID=117069 RepID=A0A9P7K5J0_9AGAR|nr:hypothetical protein H0H81_006264 [Sphagnurus paluster]
MSSESFTFLPRTVSQVKRKTTSHPVAVRNKTPRPAASNAVPPSVKENYSNEDYAALVCLGLSDYALWADAELRRTVDWASEKSGDGCKSRFHRLALESTFLAPLKLEGSQPAIAKALRSCAADVLELRLLVTDPSSSTWFGGHDDSADLGAYEVQRKDWNIGRDYTRADWDNRTLYVESIPVQYRSPHTIARFILGLLIGHPSTRPPLTRVQAIIFPPHHQDKPGDQPTCKGFALVVFEDERDANFLLSQWPWDRQHTLHGDEHSDAVKFGFRALSKTRWEHLKSEYLAYRGRLVAEINAYQEDISVLVLPVNSALPAELETTKSDTKLLDPSSPYPPNSLVFVRRLHPETNKTTLRKLFATALAGTDDSQGDGVDYVDYSKGMDSCHLRLSTPGHAQRLVEHFTKCPTVHGSALDNTGVPASSETLAVLVELVTGRREEVYWEKVPEKVRRQAVTKALGSAVAASEVRERKRRR